MTRKTVALALITLLCLLPLLGGCDGATQASGTASPEATVASAEATPEPTPEPTPTPTPEPTPEPTPASVYPADVYEYFNKVGFAGGAGESPAIAKWTVPIRIQAFGRPDDGDRAALARLVDAVRSVNGAPEISFVSAGGNLFLYFLPKSEAQTKVDGYDGSEAAYFAADWSNGSPRAGIVIANELTDRQQRDAALASSLYRALGLKADADGQYPDSVLNLGSGAAAPSERDLRMLSLLYCPELTPGMARDRAMAAVPALNPDAAAEELTAQDILSYFNEVGFYWTDSARDGIVSKWTSPIRLEITGEPTAGQQAALDATIDRLNGIEGFPGISTVSSGGNFTLTFAPRAEIAREYPQMAAAEACAWKPVRGKSGVISGCRIGAANDFADEAQSASQFLRVLIWSLGISFTSETVPDSILNLTAAAQTWSPADWAVLETLYRADVKPGAKRAAVIEELIKSPPGAPR